jgi:hypothetical protein
MSKCKGKTGRSLEKCKEQQSYVSNLKKTDSIFNVKESKVRKSIPLAKTQFYTGKKMKREFPYNAMGKAQASEFSKVMNGSIKYNPNMYSPKKGY